MSLNACRFLICWDPLFGVTLGSHTICRVFTPLPERGFVRERKTRSEKGHDC